MRLKSHYHQLTELLSSKSDKHRSAQGDHVHNHQETIPQTIKNQWSIQLPLSSGSFGSIYQGKNLITNEKVAIKFEAKTSPYPQLSKESQIYRSIEGTGMPKMYWYGSVNENYHAMVLEMLGPSIEDLYNYCHRKFTIKTVLLLGEQMLERICHIHQRSIIHRDIKPDNFTMGIHFKCQNVYLIDFGLSKYYLDRRTRQHMEYNDNKHFVGTIRYASLRTHAGIEQSRRDDLESLAYTLIYLARTNKCLPWQGIKCENKKAKQEKVYEIKLHTHIEILCENLPKEFQEFVIYTRQLGFAEEPNYVYLCSLFKQIYPTMNIKNDFIYDWIRNKTTERVL